MGGEKNFTFRSIPEVGQKQKTEKKEERKRDWTIGNNNGQLHIANNTSGGANKAAWAKNLVFPLHVP